MSTWLQFSDYDLWKTREPEYHPEQDEICCEDGCRREAEYEGRCEFHFSLRQEELAEDEMPAIEWGNVEIDDYYSSFPATLPPLVWCECGHISGQHGVGFPHPCATGGHAGCINGCKAFRRKR